MIDFKKMQMVKNPDRKEIHLNYDDVDGLRSSLVYNFEDDNYTHMDATVATIQSPEPECQPYSCDALEDFQPDDDTYEWVDVSQLVTGTTVIPSFFGSFISDRRGQPWGSYQALATMNESGDPATPKWCDIEGEAEPLSLKLVDENFGTSSLYTAPPFGGKQWYGLSMGFGFTMRGNASYIQLYWRREDENNTSIVSVDFGMNVAGGYIEIYINGTRLAAGNLLSGDATTWRYGTFYAEVIGNDVYARMSMTGFESISATLTLGPWSPTDWPAKGAAWIYGTDTIDTQYGDFIEGELQTLIDGETYFNRKFPNYAPPSYCSLGGQYPVPCMQYGRDVGWATKWDTTELQGLTWNDFNSAQEPWSSSAPRWADMAQAGGTQLMHWLTADGYYAADQVVETDNSKNYFVERTGIDLDDLVPEWTTNNWKHIRQFYFHLQSDLPEGFVGANNFDITMGWSTNLMDDPNWLPKSTINLQDTAYDGKVKWDFRSTGRYLAMRMDFDETEKLTMTGGDVDAEQAHGR